jgi:ATP-binding cassette subfamily D (ALD) protein 3
MGMLDSLLVKYGAVMTGYTVCGLPVFGPKSEEYLKSINNDPTKITKDYVRNSSLLINLAKAIGRIVVSYKDV